MTYRVLALVLAAFALMFWAGAPALAQEEKGEVTHEGTVVKASDGKLTMTGKDAKDEHTHSIARTAKITCDGKDCKLEDLKAGTKVKVTTKDKEVVKIEATTK
jgi:hypothetical protein